MFNQTTPKTLDDVEKNNLEAENKINLNHFIRGGTPSGSPQRVHSPVLNNKPQQVRTSLAFNEHSMTDLTLSSTNNNTPEQIYQKALQLMSAHQEQKALNLFKEAAAKNYLPAYVLFYHHGFDISDRQKKLNNDDSLFSKYYEKIANNLTWFIEKAEKEDVDAIFCLYILFDEVHFCEKLKQYPKGKEYFLKAAAEKGHVIAMQILGMQCNEQGNKKEALYYITQAAENGNAAAQFQLAEWYYKKDGGEYIVQNFQEAAKWAEKAALQKHPQGQYLFGICCKRGKGVEKNAKKAMELFHLAADQGHPVAAYLIGREYDAQADHQNTLKYFKIAADNGHTKAQFALATAYHDGDGVERDYEMALRYYQMAAENNHSNAQYWCGYFYCQGWVNGELEVSELLATSAKYYTLAALQDHPEALCALGKFYEMGIIESNLAVAFDYYCRAAKKGALAGMNAAGAILNLNSSSADFHEKIPQDEAWYYQACDFFHVKKNYQEAFKFFNMAAEAKHVAAQYWVGYCYQYGLGIERNQKKAVEYFQQSANQNYPEALCALGKCYEKSIIEMQDEEEAQKKAFEYYLKSADMNNGQAQYCVGESYRTGEGVDRDFCKAFEYFYLAAKQKLSTAQYRVGFSYIHGLGVSINYERAVHFFLLSAMQKNPEAKLMLGQCYEHGWGVDTDYKKAEEYYKEAALNGIKLTVAEHYDFLGKQARKKYYDGETGSEPNVKTLKDLYNKAVFPGDPNVFLQLGQYYFYGIGSALQNYNTAFEYFERAKDKEPEALYMLGFYYFYGINYLEPDLKYAVTCYKKAAAMGSANAKCALANCYYSGVVDEDDDTIVLEKNITEAAILGHAQAQYEMGKNYEFGIGVPQNYEIALEWYREAKRQNVSLPVDQNTKFFEKLSVWRSKYGRYYPYQIPRDNTMLELHKKADTGDLQAQVNLAEHYLKRKRENTNDKMAVRYAELAARQNYPKAQYIIGCLCLNGWGITKDFKAVQMYLTAAATQGYQPAIDLLKQVKQGKQMVNIHEMQCTLQQKANQFNEKETSFAPPKEPKQSIQKVNKSKYILGENICAKFNFRPDDVKEKKFFIANKSDLNSSDKSNKCTQQDNSQESDKALPTQKSNS